MEAASQRVESVGADIEIREIRKAFRRENGQLMPVLDGVNFVIRADRITCLIGPSGCGKSTLLNIMARLDKPDNGGIFVNSVPEKLKAGYVFQTPRLLPWKTVKENIIFGLKSWKVPPQVRAARAERYLRLVGLGEFINQYPLYLSGGMQQRVGLARALAVEPQLLLMDEPFSSVDELTAIRLREEMIQINKQVKQTILYVTHNLNEAAYLGDRVVVLSARPARVVTVLDNPIKDERVWGDEAVSSFAREIRARLSIFEEG